MAVDPQAVRSIEALDLPPATVFFDGLCGFCDREVQWLLARDVDQRLHYAPLQGETAAAIRNRIPGSIPHELETMVLVERDGDGLRFSYRSDAALRILAISGASRRALRILRLMPRVLRELGYRVIARIRYRVWGQLESCRVPSPSEQARFLD